MKIASLRSEVDGFGDELARAQTARYLARIQDLEAKALRLLEDIESSRGVVRH